MGEVIGFSNLSGSLVSIQTKDLMPYAVAHSLFSKLIQAISPQQSQKIIENFRASYLIINETLLFVFATLAENPFLSQDSLLKLQQFLLQVSRDLKVENLLKKLVEVNYGLEDILNNMDPLARINPKLGLFTVTKPFQSLYSNPSALLYLNKPWKEGNFPALNKAGQVIATEKLLSQIKIDLPKTSPRPTPLVHPFAVQFIDSLPPMQVKQSSVSTPRLSENSNLNLSVEPAGSVEVCKLVIMVRTT